MPGADELEGGVVSRGGGPCAAPARSHCWWGAARAPPEPPRLLWPLSGREQAFPAEEQIRSVETVFGLSHSPLGCWVTALVTGPK